MVEIWGKIFSRFVCFLTHDFLLNKFSIFVNNVQKIFFRQIQQQQPPQTQQNQQYPNLVPDEAGNIVESRKRGESIDMFLSRSPSQSLGSEFLKFRNEENIGAIPALSLNSNEGSGSSSYDFKNSQSTHVHTRMPGRGDMSPSCSVTGTSASSRSASPSWNGTSDGRRGQKMASYQQTPPGINADLGRQQHLEDNLAFQPSRGHISAHTESSFSSNHLGGSGMHLASNNYMDMNSSYDQHNHRDVHSHTNQQQHLQQHQHQPMQIPQGLMIPTNDNMMGQQQHAMAAGQHTMSNDPKAAQPGQVFYVAVPTQDGQGQVLQPIQMVQLPGQPNAFVLPSATGGTPVQFQAPQQNAGGMPQGHFMGSQGNNGYPGGDRGNRQMKQQSYYGGGGGNRGGNIGGNRMKTYTPMQNTPRSHRQSSMSSDVSFNDQASFQYGEETHSSIGADVQYATPGEHPTGQHREAVRKELLTNNEIVANLYASPKRPPLRELLGHVRRLSRDQVGCRLLQQALDEEGDSAATSILNEGLSFWGEAMVDPFGNYLFQKILEKITPSERILLIKTVSPRLVNASLNLHGTRSVQKVVELCAIDEAKQIGYNTNDPTSPESEKNMETAAEILTKALTPAAARLCIDSHGNHVIQRILLKLPYQFSQFVFQAVANSVGDVARHRHGCCVIQRCLDSPPSAARSNLVRKIVEKSLELMQDAYGNYVVQYVLDVCSDEDVHSVCESVVGKVSLLAIQKFSSNVMEKCLERCTDRVRESYLEELSEQERIRELMMDPFGNYVIQRALAVASHTQALKLVDAMRPHLMSSCGGGIRNTAGGRRILAKIERRFPHFNINEEGSIERAIHRKGTPQEGPPPTTAPQRGHHRRGPKKNIIGKDPHHHNQYQHQQYREYPQGGGAHNAVDQSYFMMNSDQRHYNPM